MPRKQKQLLFPLTLEERTQLEQAASVQSRPASTPRGLPRRPRPWQGRVPLYEVTVRERILACVRPRPRPGAGRHHLVADDAPVVPAARTARSEHLHPSGSSPWDGLVVAEEPQLVPDQAGLAGSPGPGRRRQWTSPAQTPRQKS